MSMPAVLTKPNSVQKPSLNEVQQALSHTKTGLASGHIGIKNLIFESSENENGCVICIPDPDSKINLTIATVDLQIENGKGLLKVRTKDLGVESEEDDDSTVMFTESLKELLRSAKAELKETKKLSELRLQIYHSARDKH